MDARTDGRRFVRMDICWVLEFKYFSSKYPTRPQVPRSASNLLGTFFLDTYGIKGKYQIHVYQMYAHKSARTDGQIDDAQKVITIAHPNIAQVS